MYMLAKFILIEMYRRLSLYVLFFFNMLIIDIIKCQQYSTCVYQIRMNAPATMDSNSSPLMELNVA